MPSDGPPLPTVSGPALREAKFALRTRCLARRDALPAQEHAAASAAIAAGIAAIDSWVQAPAVLVTLPFGSEWNTRPLVDAALAGGKAVVLPRVNPGTRMLDLFAIRDPESDVEPGFQGIPEPRTSCRPVPAADVRWVLVPGVAFDARGARLGYGGGFYDRLLPLVPAGAPRVAGAFALQLVERVPVAGHDARIDTLVTECGTLDLRRRERPMGER
ncbi:MAG: 5-formyltetrahydrofolate cyclo-ligase [Betaproteobacteria bacterium]|nr:5-formyltetrahydrofolate cyclo-ligase [Betaproteobacteria bacterium]